MSWSNASCVLQGGTCFALTTINLYGIHWIHFVFLAIKNSKLPLQKIHWYLGPSKHTFSSLEVFCPRGLFQGVGKNVSKGFDLLRQGRRNRSRLSPFPKAKSHREEGTKKFPRPRRVWDKRLSPFLVRGDLTWCLGDLRCCYNPIYHFLCLRGTNPISPQEVRQRKSFKRKIPIGSRESFTWIILKTILCLVLDFQGICRIEHLTTLILKR